jgi:hypothetical protein
MVILTFNLTQTPEIGTAHVTIHESLVVESCSKAQFQVLIDTEAETTVAVGIKGSFLVVITTKII